MHSIRKYCLTSILLVAILIGIFYFFIDKTPKNMRWIPGGTFTMGTNDNHSMMNERPSRTITLEGFWMDENLVTNEDFDKFIQETGYITTAEQTPIWEELQKQLPPNTPKPDVSLLVPGSLVFVPPQHAVPLNRINAWWKWLPSAQWRNPEGPGSHLQNRKNHPVVHVSWIDAMAYAKWAKKRLPTEAEWEYAARGGLEGKRFPWGDEFKPQNKHMANTFQGTFPHDAIAEDGYTGTSPVKSYPANGYHLFDMVGNVWEWTQDWYALNTADPHQINHNPQGPIQSFDPLDPHAQKRVIKGGSFLCHVDYCESYRPSARRGQTPDTSTSHIGFRLVVSKEK